MATILVDANGGGAFTTISAAIAAAEANDTIQIAAGTYAENVVVSKSLTIVGLGEPGGVVIQGTIAADNSIPEGTSLFEWIKTQTAYTGSAGAGITVAANDVTIENLSIDGFLHGIALQTNSGLTVEDVDITNAIIGIHRDTTFEVTDFDLIGGSISDGVIGINVAAASDDGSFDDILIDGTSFDRLAYKGIYFEQLSNAVIENISMEDVGDFGRPRPSATRLARPASPSTST